MREFQFLLLKNCIFEKCKKQQCVGVSKRGTSIWELQVGNGKNELITCIKLFGVMQYQKKTKVIVDRSRINAGRCLSKCKLIIHEVILTNNMEVQKFFVIFNIMEVETWSDRVVFLSWHYGKKKRVNERVHFMSISSISISSPVAGLLDVLSILTEGERKSKWVNGRLMRPTDNKSGHCAYLAAGVY